MLALACRLIVPNYIRPLLSHLLPFKGKTAIHNKTQSCSLSPLIKPLKSCFFGGYFVLAEADALISYSGALPTYRLHHRKLLMTPRLLGMTPVTDFHTASLSQSDELISLEFQDCTCGGLREKLK